MTMFFKDLDVTSHFFLALNAQKHYYNFVDAYFF